ncbi:hypothetical protein DFQ26_006942 [Actinomortierella ambigua]|nr:hypothetical protein DFQ26_006942 [Actinomortierella ambigua]
MGYTDAFLTERPHDGLDAVQARLRRGKTLHEQLANYFKERAHIEDLYAKSIAKAFQKHFVTDTSILGTFTSPWERLSEETNELAALHGQLSLRIASEIEKPLRDYARLQPAWQNLTLAETNCARLAKEYDEKQVKVTKYTKTVERVTSGKKAEQAEQKLMQYSKQLESTRTAWRLEGPVVLQKYQDVDHGRLAHLKEMISNFEAIQTETALQVVEMSAKTSASVAEFDPVMDLELFASGAATNMHTVAPAFDAEREGSFLSAMTRNPQGNSGGGGGGGAVVGDDQDHYQHQQQQQQQQQDPHIQSSSNHSDTVSSLEPRKSNGTHRRGMTSGSQMSNTSFSTEFSHGMSKAGSIDQGRGFGGTLSPPASEHGFGNGRSLGGSLDVPGMTNRVDADGYSIPPPDNSPWAEAAAAAAGATTSAAASTAGGNGGGGGMGAGSIFGDDEKSETSSFFSHMTPNRMQMEIRQDSVSENTEEAKAAIERVASTLKAANTVSRRPRGRREVRSVYHASEDSLSATTHQHPHPSHSLQQNGSSSGGGATPEASPSGSRMTLNLPVGGVAAAGSSGSLASPPHNLRASTIGFSTTTTSSSSLSSTSSPLTPTFPPSVMRSATVGAAVVTAPHSEGSAGESPSTNPFAQQQQQQQPVAVVSLPPLTLTPASSTGTSMVLSEGQPLAAEPEAIQEEVGGEEERVAVSPSPPPLPELQPLEAANGGIVATAAGSTTLRDDGGVELGTSVVEKVHLLSQGGEIAKMMVTGEVSLHLDRFLGQESQSGEGRQRCRGRLVLTLRRTDELDKFVPNPGFMTAVEGSSSSFKSEEDQQHQQQEQQYQLDVEALRAARQAGQTAVVVLKYQVRAEEGPRQQQLVPLLVVPAWKIEPHQTSLLINYKANARCRLASATSPVQLTDVSFLVPVAGKVIQVQSRPNGIWSEEANKMLWEVAGGSGGAGLTMDEHPEPHKLLARFELDQSQPSPPEGQNGPAAVKFRIVGRLLSAIEVAVEQEKEPGQEGDVDGQEKGDEVEEQEGVIRMEAVQLQVQSGRYLATA